MLYYFYDACYARSSENDLQASKSAIYNVLYLNLQYGYREEPPMTEQLRLMCVLAHPDDELFGQPAARWQSMLLKGSRRIS